MKGYYSSLTSPGKVSDCYKTRLLEFSYSHGQSFLLDLFHKISVDKQRKTLHEEQEVYTCLWGKVSHVIKTNLWSLYNAVKSSVPCHLSFVALWWPDLCWITTATSITEKIRFCGHSHYFLHGLHSSDYLDHIFILNSFLCEHYQWTKESGALHCLKKYQILSFYVRSSSITFNLSLCWKLWLGTLVIVRFWYRIHTVSRAGRQNSRNSYSLVHI